MSIFKKIQAISATCDYAFCSLRDVIIQLERNGRRNGFENPAAQIVISPVNNEEYDVNVALYYKRTDEDFEVFKKKIHIYSFTNVPEDIKDLLLSGKEQKITFTQEDMVEFMNNKDLPISTQGESLSKLLDAALSRTEHLGKENIQIVVRNFVLYYRVILNIKDENEKWSYLTEFLTSSISGIPKEEIKELAEKHEIYLLTRCKKM